MSVLLTTDPSLQSPVCLPLIFFFFLKKAWMTWYSPCSPGWPLTHSHLPKHWGYRCEPPCPKLALWIVFWLCTVWFVGFLLLRDTTNVFVEILAGLWESVSAHFGSRQWKCRRLTEERWIWDPNVTKSWNLERCAPNTNATVKAEEVLKLIL